MVSNSAKLDCSTLNLESLRVTVPEIWPGQKWRKKKKKERRQSHKASPTGIANYISNNRNNTVVLLLPAARLGLFLSSMTRMAVGFSMI